VVARYGGDEFIILMPETGIEQAQVLAERCASAGNRSHCSKSTHHGSFGVASFPVHGFSVEDLIRVADAACTSPSTRAATGFHLGRVRRRHGATPARLKLHRRLSAARAEWDQRTSKNWSALCANSVEAKTGRSQGNPGGVEALSRAAELREHNAEGHGEQCAQYAGMIARGLKLSDRQVADVTFAGRIHDVGKLFIPVRILNKSGALTEDEFSAIKTHAQPERKWLE